MKRPTTSLRPIARLAGMVVGTAALTGCAWVAGSPPEEPPRECARTDALLPGVEELLDPERLVASLRARADDADEIVLTLSVHAEGDQIRIFGGEAEESVTLGAWPILLREALRSPLPDGIAPGLRVRLTPGDEAGVALEPATYCPPILRNEAEVEERYRSQLSDSGVVPADVTFVLSDLGGIRTLDVRMPDGASDLEILARRALRFARFDPALLDGRRMPATVQMRFPTAR